MALLNNTIISSHNDDLVKMLEGAGIDKLVTIFGEQFNRRITNMKCSRIPLQKRKTLITSKILEAVNKSNDENIAKLILDTYFVKKPKNESNAEWLNDFVVGEEIIITNAFQQGRKSGRTIHRKGKIHKINKKSVSVKLFGYNEVDDMHAIINQTYGTNKLIWLKFTNDSKVVFNRNQIVKKGECSWNDDEFIEGKRSVDYGN